MKLIVFTSLNIHNLIAKITPHFKWTVPFNNSCEKSPKLINVLEKMHNRFSRRLMFCSFPTLDVLFLTGTNLMYTVNNGKLYFCYALYADLLKVHAFYSNNMFVFPKTNIRLFIPLFYLR